MLSSSAWRPFPRYMAEPEPVEETEEVTQYEHDLILRYAIVGIFVILFTATLYLTKVIAVPVTAGVIFGLVLGPLVDWLVRHGVPQHLAAATVTLLFLGVLMGALAILAVPVAGWADQAPAMMAGLQAKLARLFAFMDEFKRSIASITGKGGELSVSQGNPLFDIAMTSSTAAGGMLIFVATVYFWLATRRHLKARVLRFCLRDARRSAGSFFEEIEARVARYFALVTVINLGMGLLTMAIAWLAGLPFPVFWGALAFLLNYLAFIGPIIVAVLLFAGALLDAPSLLAALWPATAYYILHLFEGNAVTPVFVGNRLTISPFLVFIAFIFWLWLWGPVGAVLSTPIVIVFMVAQEEFARYRREKAKAAAEETAAAEPA
ncbi:putative PurR-regulated permease PerM OS=Bosea thiooxidans OX=53254 GN=SAMN05660750_03991 PE=3 SV=1 [Bosea thiooxidans]|uniref:Predicted PurR-regulated permease PerM n=2 Tax=Bosea thiooxidans TaxID=53254 RepID=A0A1T5GDT2_9HYPH|nr:AI-2E family transporter [Bosea thiooxidans]SKC06594.1 Predicted PurR-regulated permease PerM [Bosea thiooxidans]